MLSLLVGSMMATPAVATASPAAAPSARSATGDAPSRDHSARSTSDSSTVVQSAYPTPGTTGVPSGTALRSNSDCDLESGTYTAQRWTCRVKVRGTVTVRNSELIQGVQVESGSLVLEDSTVGPASGCAQADQAMFAWSDYTLRRVEVRNVPEGARSEGPNINITDSFFGMCEQPDPAHGDAFQGCLIPGSPDCGSEPNNLNNKFNHNTVIMPDGAALEGITAPIFWSDGSSDGLEVRDNLLAGGGFTIRIHSGSGHIVTGNRVVRDSYRWGPVDCEEAGSMTYDDNRLVTIDANYNITWTAGEDFDAYGAGSCRS